MTDLQYMHICCARTHIQTRGLLQRAQLCRRGDRACFRTQTSLGASPSPWTMRPRVFKRSNKAPHRSPWPCGVFRVCPAPPPCGLAADVRRVSPRRGPTTRSYHRCSALSRRYGVGTRSDALTPGLMQPLRRSHAQSHLLRQYNADSPRHRRPMTSTPPRSRARGAQ